jgi:hypothetical protein
MEKVMVDDAVVNAEEFHSDFTAMYCDSEKKAKAEAALRALKQTKSVAHYTHQFNLHAHNAGWETSTLISQYKQGLKTQVRLVLLMARTEFAHLSEIANLALKVDNELNGMNPQDTSPTPDPNAMDLSVMRGRLSDAEKTRMMRTGQCFRCGKPGHIARECPDKDSKGKGKERTRIAELEEEVKKLKAGVSKAESSKNGGAQE